MDFDVVVVGAGPGGLVVAIGAAKVGKRVCLIDRGSWGGDCTNFGCVPSKTLIAAAQQGLGGREALERVRATVGKIRAHEDPAALEKLGVTAIEGEARFVDRYTLEVNGQRVRGKQIVIATGTRARIPESVKGLDYLTNETVFDLKDVPEKLTVLGGGPIGCELAMAFARLGSKVRLLQSRDRLLLREEREVSDLLVARMGELGIDVQLGVNRVDGLEANERLLVAAGRQPNVEGLRLEAAGIEMRVDGFGRTNRKHIWAVGDVTRDAPFTHVAENRARAVLLSLSLPGPLKKRIDYGQAIPRCTYTDPEVASIGLTENEARGAVAHRLSLERVDRAVCEGKTEGYIKIVARRWGGRILGATIVAPHAGEMLSEIALAMRCKVSLRKLTTLIHPYPTYSSGIRQTADLWLREVFKGA